MELVIDILTHFIDDLLSSPRSAVPILAGPVESDEAGKSRAADLESYPTPMTYSTPG